MAHGSDAQIKTKLSNGWAGLLLAWLIGLWLIPDPRPLSAPDWAIRTVQSIGVRSEPKARVAAAIILRTAGIAVLGILLAMSLQNMPLHLAAPIVLGGTPLLAVAVKWLNFGYFPVWTQLQFILLVAFLSGLLGLSLRRSRLAMVGLIAAAAVLFGWGVWTKVPEDLEQAARATGQHLLAHASQIENGDEAFTQLLRMAFAFAEENSHGEDPVFANRAAILALGVIVGDENVARVGWSTLSTEGRKERDRLRGRVTLRGRSDLPKHFTVSAALTVLADENRALTVGIAKEASDSNPGGSGFSFVDMLANKAGIRLASLATRNAAYASTFQQRLIESAQSTDFMPSFDGLPEGLTSEDFQANYGGLGGSKTVALFDEIDRRLDDCSGLRLP